jgi:TonB-dependent SusC/RagA subfamily outer membrane receptor
MLMLPRPLLIFAGAAALAGGASCSRSGSTATRPAADSVSIGYGAQPKDKVIGAVTTLREEDLGPRPLRIEAMLRGKVPGLVMTGTGNTLTLRFRGTSSLLLDQEPLVIVDDVMIQTGNIGNALAGLSPEDVKQVSVLKDVASTSIYGSRGAGGVILIQTKAKPEREEGAR